MTIDPRSFLATVTGYARRTAATTSADRPIRLATVDPDYTGTGAPKVTFDGESTLSSKLYAFVDSYRPAASDRVVLIPVGTTYLIAGKISAGTSKTPGGVLDLATTTASTSLTAAGGGTVTDVDTLSVSWDAVTGRYYRVTLRTLARSTVADDILSFYVTDDSDTIIFRSDMPVGPSQGTHTVYDSYLETVTSDGAVTRKLRFNRAVGTGAPTAFADATRPSYLLVEDAGGT